VDGITLLYLFASAMVLGAVAILCLATARSVTRRVELIEERDRLSLQFVHRAPRLDLLLPGIILIVAAWWLTSAVVVGPGLASLFAGVAVAIVGATLGAVVRTTRWVFDRGHDQLRHGRTVHGPLSAVASVGVIEGSEPGGQSRLYVETRAPDGTLRRHLVGGAVRLEEFLRGPASGNGRAR
jgi:hypothetical protein